MNEILQRDIARITEVTLSGTGDSDQHLMVLYGLALTSRAKTIIELGTRTATTALPLIMAASQTQGHVYMVDIDDCQSYINEMVDESYNDHYTFVKKDAIEFLKDWDPAKHIDIIFIDDWHSYDQVKAELEILGQKASYKTIILLHDLMFSYFEPYYHRSLETDGEWANGGPYRAVSELNFIGWEYSTLPYCNGLTILRKKPPNIMQTRYNIIA